MSFQLREQDTRPYQYPNAQDMNFLGYDRDLDRWKVDASGIHLYASGISVDLDKDNDSVAVWSASGTTDIPVYITSPVEVEVDIGDSIKVLSSSGTASIPTYMPDSRFDGAGNQYVIGANNLVPKEYDYIALSYTGANVTGVTYKVGGSGGSIVAALALGYDGSDNLTSVERT